MSFQEAFVLGMFILVLITVAFNSLDKNKHL